MIPVGEALTRVLEATHALGAERVTILDALGRVAAEDVVSRRAVPAAPYSAMDGYAVRHADVSAAPARLRIVAVEPAGTVVATAVETGTAVKLFTGSVIPRLSYPSRGGWPSQPGRASIRRSGAIRLPRVSAPSSSAT